MFVLANGALVAAGAGTLVVLTPAGTELTSFTSPVHASLDEYGLAFLIDGDTVPDDLVGSQTVDTAACTVNGSNIRIDVEDVSTAALTPAQAYSVYVRTVQTIGGVTVYGPWSDTGDDYTA